MSAAWTEQVRAVLVPHALAESFGVLTADVHPIAWADAALACRDVLQLTSFDWLSAVDELDGRFGVVTHVYSPRTMRRLLLRTSIDVGSGDVLRSISGVYRGASWHERETHEMFGVPFDGHPNLTPLLLPDGFAGHPLRKDFVLAARVAKAWPGAKEPGESSARSPARRSLRPPGVPGPDEWGPGAERASGDEGDSGA